MLTETEIVMVAAVVAAWGCALVFGWDALSRKHSGTPSSAETTASIADGRHAERRRRVGPSSRNALRRVK